ncbi:MAG: hypothetical protein M3R38_28330 [Actinomycetota bacterium]|nr:hypothetical protein [Actinomycetota bacterium]
MAELVLGLIRDPEVLREEAERQAEGERRRLRRADREAEKLRGVLRGLENKRERLMDLALDGPFSRDEIARGAASLDAARRAAERELDGLGGGVLEARLQELEALPALVEAYLRDLPDLVSHRRVVRDYGTIPAERTPDNPPWPLPPDARKDTAQDRRGDRGRAPRRRERALRPASLRL